MDIFFRVEKVFATKTANYIEELIDGLFERLPRFEAEKKKKAKAGGVRERRITDSIAGKEAARIEEGSKTVRRSNEGGKNIAGGGS
jgi:hypothetical protein